jgi:hypothetical protein
MALEGFGDQLAEASRTSSADVPSSRTITSLIMAALLGATGLLDEITDLVGTP